MRTAIRKFVIEGKNSSTKRVLASTHRLPITTGHNLPYQAQQFGPTHPVQQLRTAASKHIPTPTNPLLSLRAEQTRTLNQFINLRAAPSRTISTLTTRSPLSNTTSV